MSMYALNGVATERGSGNANRETLCRQAREHAKRVTNNSIYKRIPV